MAKGNVMQKTIRGQGVLPYWKREKISWCGCRGGKEQSSTRARDSRGTVREERAVWPREAKVQQGSVRSREPKSIAKERESGVPTERKSTAREGGSQLEVRRTFKMLREV